VVVDLKETEHGGFDWIHLEWKTDEWRALVNKVINLALT
jgi:hypothetical protein